MISEKTQAIVLDFQKTELTEYFVYKALARRMDGKNRDILEKIAEDELRHHNQWKPFTKKRVRPNRIKLFFYLLTARILGLTFAIKMMENGEKSVEKNYQKIVDEVPQALEIMQEEIEHENLLVGMIDEKRISYIGSMVLGLNDALVELTGALAGLTFALQNTRLVGVAGLITGIAASLSMAASEYLSQKSEIGDKSPITASIYTGIAYVFTVVFLVIPFFLVTNHYFALMFTIFNAFIIIFLFTFYVSVVRELSFSRLFIEMALVSLGVAIITFCIGWVARKLLNIEV